jgi:hypothetical protein
MDNNESGPRNEGHEQAAPATKRPYVRPSFASEQAFEVNALACVKVAVGAGCGAPVHLT